jgi:hypothetical protein
MKRHKKASEKAFVEQGGRLPYGWVIYFVNGNTCDHTVTNMLAVPADLRNVLLRWHGPLDLAALAVLLEDYRKQEAEAVQQWFAAKTLMDKAEKQQEYLTKQLLVRFKALTPSLGGAHALVH